MLSFERIIADQKITIVTHHRIIHADELAALWLAEKFADQNFLKTYCPNKILTLGVGGGTFDEHSPDKKGECCTTLMATVLGVSTGPNLQKILKFITNSDLTTSGNQFDIARIVKVWQTNKGKVDLQELIKWFFLALDANYATDGAKEAWVLAHVKALIMAHFHNASADDWFAKGLAVHEQDNLEFLKAGEEFKKTAQIENFQRNGKTFRLIVLKSDNPKINRYARWKNGGDAAIVIQKSSSENVSIFTNDRYQIRLYDLAKMLNLAEQDLNGGRQTTNWQTLSQEGFIPGGRWYNLQGKCLLNGSLTHPKISPTGISLKNIVSLAKIALSSSSFEPSRAKICQQGKCTATQQNVCPWYAFGLFRCIKIRKSEKPIFPTHATGHFNPALPPQHVIHTI